MINKEKIKNYLHRERLLKRDKLLLCMACDADTPKKVKEIKEIAISGGWRGVQQLNISQELFALRSLAVRTDKGWELTDDGKKHVEALIGSEVLRPIEKVAESLRPHLKKINNQQTQDFVEQAIQCSEFKLYRAAVVLSWVGAVSVLYDYIFNNMLIEFNMEAKRRYPNWKNAKTKDDLAELKEYDFLDIVHAISVIGKSVKEELRGCLKFRNGCGHPNSLRIGENRVSAHIETLILNVFSKF